MRTKIQLTKSCLLTALLILTAACLQAQVTIGDATPPSTSSVLDIMSDNGTRGLRLPQLSEEERMGLEATWTLLAQKTAAKGLMIFNTDTKCVETWNGSNWIAKCAQFTVTYNPNGGAGIAFDEEAGNGYTVADNPFTLAGSVYIGWNTAADGTGTNYYPGDPISLTANMTLYAQWRIVPAGGGTTTPPTIIRYVGAFWRAEEIGERIIRMQVTGSYASPWVAVVTYLDNHWDPASGDGVLLDTEMLTTGELSARNISFSSVTSPYNNPSSAEGFTLPSTAKDIISGDASAGSSTPNTIIFRIGLQKKGSTSTTWTPSGDNPSYSGTDFPARYAIVTLFYGPNLGYSMNLYLRQGEHADYLMHYNDAISSGNMNNARTSGALSASSARPAAKRFSPYNLTAATLDQAVGINGANPSSIFTAYPTQSGAFFQWATPTNTRFAWNSHTTVPVWTPSVPWGWGLDMPKGNWNTHGSTNESCPAGYRRPTDGIIDPVIPIASANAVSSEFRQSLWLNPQNGTTGNSNNAINGYYADGFFDRRAIVNGAGTSPGTNSSVSNSDYRIAHRGHLFYNSDPLSNRYNASLFFPNSGYRDGNASGTLYFTGSSGYYYSSSSVTTIESWYFYASSTLVRMNSSYRLNGFPLRCVRQ